MMTIRMFQICVAAWVKECLGFPMLMDKKQRCECLAEETAEVLQAAGMTQEQVIECVLRVYAKPAGEVPLELGDAAVALAAFAEGHNIDLQVMAQRAHDRCLANSLLIRRKNEERMKQATSDIKH